jgi:hypothetical protein
MSHESQCQDYRWRILIEHLCPHCGCGFSSYKPNPQFCSRECYLEANKDRFSAHAKELWQTEGFRTKIAAARQKAGYKINPDSAIRCRLRRAVKNALRRCIRRTPHDPKGTFRLLHYTPTELKEHLESLFQPGMTWGNYGLWEIDHRRPIADFPVETPLHVINALSNLQPLWKAENRRKWSHVWI